MYAFAGIATTYDEVKFPSPADDFVTKLGIFNLDIIGYIPAKCFKKDANFYTTLKIKTLGPICVIAFLALACRVHMTYAMQRLKKLHQGTSDPRKQIATRVVELRVPVSDIRAQVSAAASALRRATTGSSPREPQRSRRGGGLD